MRSFLFSCLLAAGAMTASAQGYQFTDVCRVPATPVKNQASTGTCWCFATTSFMESELLRMGKGTYDLSEDKGYQIVWDRASAMSIIFASPKIDISKEVLEKLGYSK